MIEIRKLAPEEFDLLKKVSDGFCPDPQKSAAFVAEDNGQVVGRIFLLAPIHLEGPFVEPKWHGTTVFRRLVKEAEIEAWKQCVRTVFAYAVDETMEDYIQRLGYTKTNMTVWKKELPPFPQV